VRTNRAAIRQRRHRFSYTVIVAGPQAHVIQAYIKHQTYSMHTVKRKTITIREDQEEWIQENHLNLSSFVQEQLDELIEERDS
jgi:hypothetical protein